MIKGNTKDGKILLKQKCMSIGIVPLEPRIFWDYDLGNNEEPYDAIKTITTYIVRLGVRKNRVVPYAVYTTKYGFHLILKLETWDEVQAELYILKELTNKQSIMSCRRQRIRIGEKIIKITGEKISPKPILLSSNTTEELRVGRKEIYDTFDRSYMPNIPEKIYEFLGEKKDG